MNKIEALGVFSEFRKSVLRNHDAAKRLKPVLYAHVNRGTNLSASYY